MTENRVKSAKVNIIVIMNIVDVMLILGMLYGWDGEHRTLSLVLIAVAVIFKTVLRFMMATP